MNAKCMINRLVNLINDDGIFDGLAGPFICRLTKYIALLDSSSEHEHGTSICEMTVHAIKLDIIDDVGLFDLLPYLQLRPAFDHHVPAELSCQDDHGPVQVSGLFQVLDKLSDWAINPLFHFDQARVTVFMGIPIHEGLIFCCYTDEPCTFLGEPLGHQTTQSKFSCIVNIIAGLWLLVKVKCSCLWRFEQPVSLFHGALHGFLVIIRSILTHRPLVHQISVQLISFLKPGFRHTDGWSNRIQSCCRIWNHEGSEFITQKTCCMKGL